jgi:hypothetical protein
VWGRSVLAALAERKVRRIVLHASDYGRPLYERLGFVPTNEMRLETLPGVLMRREDKFERP